MRVLPFRRGSFGAAAFSSPALRCTRTTHPDNTLWRPILAGVPTVQSKYRRV